jgi:hypothetical protein
MTAKRSRRPVLRRSDLDTAYRFAAENGLAVRGLTVGVDGGFSLDFGPPGTANDDAVDQELAALERRHGEGRA